MLSTTRKVLKSSKRLNKAKEEVLSLEKQREDLLKDIKYKETEAYIEEVARNELNLIKPGEEIYIYPEDTEKAPKKRAEENNPYGTLNKTQKKPIQEWKDLIF